MPDDARLRPVKKAMLGAVRPVTSNQAPFNRAVLQAIDGTAAALESLAHQVELSELHAGRLQAGVATTEGTVDDLVEEVRALRTEVSDLAARLDAERSTAEAAATEAATVRAQLDLVLRTAREALAGQGITTDQLSELSRELSALGLL